MRKRQLKNTTAYGFKLCKMNDETYALRKKVMSVIYEAKKVVDLPRVEVRIVEKKECIQSVLGYAYTGNRIIHIPVRTVKANEKDMRQTVLHEVVHAVAGFKHDPDCVLMSPVHQYGISEAKIWDAFKKYFK